ncbi:17-beta-hydroxysteroid dehydrogenase type 1 isoform X1 [Rhinolophus sinicus]|uniref:17-beta-hydroxysteroid dehydrogenase type 1 isoform X1 n=1 Tax=Rhinolophus sinicus TaxID=89399 RepID=UPI003D797A7D
MTVRKSAQGTQCPHGSPHLLSKLRPPSDQQLKKVVLITGCSSGIGLHLALRLASDPSRSFKVYATLRDLSTQGPLWEAARSRGCPPGSLETLQLDVQDADSVAAARARVTEGRVDVLVCNAGRGLLGPLEAHSADAVGSVLDVNVVGTVRMLQAFLPDMKRRGSGHILVTASMGGLMGEWKRRGLVRLARRAPCGSAPQQLHLPLKGCLSTLFTAPASSRSKVYARVWQFCCRPSGSSELPPSPWNPLNPDFGNTHTRLVGVVPRRSPWPLSTAAHICCVPGTVLGPWHKCDERVSLIECGPVHTAFQEKVQNGPGAALDGVDAQTRELFSRYQRHFEQVFRKAAQDPEEVTEVFLTALRASPPALRYFSSERFLPLARLRLADPSGCSYVAAMHRAVFGDEAAEGPEGTQTEAGAGELGGPELGAPPSAPQ